MIPLEGTSTLESMVDRVQSVVGKPHIYGLSIAELERRKKAVEQEV